jgi:hypothetical protein
MFKIVGIAIALCAVCIHALPLSAGGPGHRVAPISRSNEIGSAFCENGKVKIELREVQARMIDPHGKSEPLRIFLLFEPQSGAFNWTVTDDVSPTDPSLQMRWFKSEHAAFLRGGNLILFAAEAVPLRISIEDHPGHASSMDDAEVQALGSLAVFNDPPRDDLIARPFRSVALPGLTKDFVFMPGSAVSGPDPKVIDVQWDGRHWIVSLQALWTEVITLDSNYNLMSIEKVNLPKARSQSQNK